MKHRSPRGPRWYQREGTWALVLFLGVLLICSCCAYRVAEWLQEAMK